MNLRTAWTFECPNRDFSVVLSTYHKSKAYKIDAAKYTGHSFLIRAGSVPAHRNGQLLISNSQPELEMTRIRN